MEDLINIYKITNKINNKSYIGFTKYPIELQFKKHCSGALPSKHNWLYKAIIKDGAENFTIELIERVSEDLAQDRKALWCVFYNSCSNNFIVEEALLDKGYDLEEVQGYNHWCSFSKYRRLKFETILKKKELIKKFSKEYLLAHPEFTIKEQDLKKNPNTN